MRFIPSKPRKGIVGSAKKPWGSGNFVDLNTETLDAGSVSADSLKVDGVDMSSGIALVGTMTGGTASADHADDTSVTPIEVVAANESGDGARAILIIVSITETFAAVTNKPIFVISNGDTVTYATIGYGGSPAAPSEGEVYTFAGSLAEGDPLNITVTDGTGGSEAGAIEVFAITLPAA
jgi:hypothetical protein